MVRTRPNYNNNVFLDIMEVRLPIGAVGWAAFCEDYKVTLSKHAIHLLFLLTID